MSDTISPSESEYPSFSESTETPEVETPEVAIEQPDPSVAEPEPAVAAPAEPVESDEEDLQARNARLARELREQRRLQRQLQEQNAVLAGQRSETPDEATQRQIMVAATQLAHQQEVNKRSNDIYQEGCRAFGRAEFDQSVQAVNASFGQQIMPIVLDTLVDLPDPAKLLQHLGDNPDVADQLAMLPPHKLGAALMREAAKVAAPKPKPVSRAPTPVRPIQTQPTVEPETDMESMSMEQLARLWDKRDYERRFR